MKVLSIAFDNSEYAIRLASALATEDDVCLMVPATTAEPHLKWLDPTVDFQPFDKPRLRQPIQQLRTMALLYRRIRRVNPDVIYLQKAHLWFNLTLPFLAGHPLVISVHDPRDHSGDKDSKRTPQFIKDFGYRQADQIIVHSQAMKPMVTNELGIPASKIHVVPVMVAGDEHAQPDVTEEINQILFFGRIWQYKGLEYLIRAQPLINAEIPTAKIIIAGRGDDFTPYRELMHEPSHFVVRNEYISTEEQARLFRQASVVVLPYTEATQSGVIPVAYNFAKPVVATTVGGLVEQVEEGRTGFLVPPRDEVALAERIVYLLRNGDPASANGTEWQTKIG